MKSLKRTIHILVIITLPLLLILTSIRLILTPIFLEIEYRAPGFPHDLYGFNLEDRLYFSDLAREYLINSSDINFLGSLRLEDGLPLFSERELGHMEDVKHLTKSALSLWYGLILSYTLIIIVVWKSGNWVDLFRSLLKGSWITVGFVGIIAIGVLLSFNSLFTFFHTIFFEGDTWLFSYNDSLIRLFPLRFWQDVFIAIGGLSVLFSFLVILITKKQFETK